MRTATKIKLAREAAGLSQREAADRSGIPFHTYTKLEQGTIAEPKLVDVVAIASVLGGTCVDYAPDDAPEPEPSGFGRPKSDDAPSAPTEPPVEQIKSKRK